MTRLDGRLARLERVRRHRPGPPYEIWEAADDSGVNYRNAITGEVIDRSTMKARSPRQIIVEFLPPQADARSSCEPERRHDSQ
jgi:hypothetical protein